MGNNYDTNVVHEPGPMFQIVLPVALDLCQFWRHELYIVAVATKFYEQR